MTEINTKTYYVLYAYDDTILGIYSNIEDATEVYKHYGAYLTQTINSEKIIRDRRV